MLSWFASTNSMKPSLPSAVQNEIIAEISVAIERNFASPRRSSAWSADSVVTRAVMVMVSGAGAGVLMTAAPSLVLLGVTGQTRLQSL